MQSGEASSSADPAADPTWNALCEYCGVVERLAVLRTLQVEPRLLSSHTHMDALNQALDTHQHDSAAAVFKLRVLQKEMHAMRELQSRRGKVRNMLFRTARKLRRMQRTIEDIEAAQSVRAVEMDRFKAEVLQQELHLARMQEQATEYRQLVQREHELLRMLSPVLMKDGATSSPIREARRLRREKQKMAARLENASNARKSLQEAARHLRHIRNMLEWTRPRLAWVQGMKGSQRLGFGSVTSPVEGSPLQNQPSTSSLPSARVLLSLAEQWQAAPSRSFTGTPSVTPTTHTPPSKPLPHSTALQPASSLSAALSADRRTSAEDLDAPMIDLATPRDILAGKTGATQAELTGEPAVLRIVRLADQTVGGSGMGFAEGVAGGQTSRYVTAEETADETASSSDDVSGTELMSTRRLPSSGRSRSSFSLVQTGAPHVRTRGESIIHVSSQGAINGYDQGQQLVFGVNAANPVAEPMWDDLQTVHTDAMATPTVHTLQPAATQGIRLFGSEQSSDADPPASADDDSSSPPVPLVLPFGTFLLNGSCKPVHDHKGAAVANMASDAPVGQPMTGRRSTEWYSTTEVLGNGIGLEPAELLPKHPPPELPMQNDSVHQSNGVNIQSALQSHSRQDGTPSAAADMCLSQPGQVAAHIGGNTARVVMRGGVDDIGSGDNTLADAGASASCHVVHQAGNGAHAAEAAAAAGTSAMKELCDVELESHNCASVGDLQNPPPQDILHPSPQDIQHPPAQEPTTVAVRSSWTSMLWWPFAKRKVVPKASNDRMLPGDIAEDAEGGMGVALQDTSATQLQWNQAQPRHGDEAELSLRSLQSGRHFDGSIARKSGSVIAEVGMNGLAAGTLTEAGQKPRWPMPGGHQNPSLADADAFAFGHGSAELQGTADEAPGATGVYQSDSLPAWRRSASPQGATGTPVVGAPGGQGGLPVQDTRIADAAIADMQQSDWQPGIVFSPGPAAGDQEVTPGSGPRLATPWSQAAVAHSLDVAASLHASMRADTMGLVQVCVQLMTRLLSANHKTMAAAAMVYKARELLPSRPPMSLDRCEVLLKGLWDIGPEEFELHDMNDAIIYAAVQQVMHMRHEVEVVVAWLETTINSLEAKRQTVEARQQLKQQEGQDKQRMLLMDIIKSVRAAGGHGVM